MNWRRWLWFIITLYRFTRVTVPEREDKYAVESHFMGSYFQMWFCKNTRDVQDSVWTILKNYNRLLLFTQPRTPSNSPPRSVILQTLIHVHLYYVRIPKSAARIHQFNVRLVVSWQSHGKFSTHWTASWMLPRKHAINTEMQSLDL